MGGLRTQTFLKAWQETKCQSTDQPTKTPKTGEARESAVWWSEFTFAGTAARSLSEPESVMST